MVCFLMYQYTQGESIGVMKISDFRFLMYLRILACPEYDFFSLNKYYQNFCITLHRNKNITLNMHFQIQRVFLFFVWKKELNTVITEKYFLTLNSFSRTPLEQEEFTNSFWIPVIFNCKFLVY